MNLVLTSEDPLCMESDAYLLGAWCIDYRSHQNSIRVAEKRLIDNPFLNQEVVRKAYQTVKKTIDYLFPMLCYLLNQYHNVQYSERYWQILLGYWWLEFIENTYARYELLKIAAITLPNATVNVTDPMITITPYDTCDYAMLNNNDFYNHYVFSQMVYFLKLFNPVILNSSSINLVKLPPLKKDKLTVFKKINYFLSRYNKFYFASTYINRKSLLAIAMNLKQLPILLNSPRFLGSKDRQIDKISRKKLIFLGQNEFENLIGFLLSSHIPKIYLEDFAQLKKTTKFYFPTKKIHSILTAAAFADNESFKLFTAEQVEKFKTPYIIAQHGGCYGAFLWHHCEEYEKKVADYYLTYGWAEKHNPKVVPFIANRFSAFNHTAKGRKQGEILYVLTTSSRYPRMLNSTIEGPNFIQYLNAQADFLLALPDFIRIKFTVRPYQAESGWHELHYLEKKSYPLRLSNIKLSFSKAAKRSRLVICTYNGSAHLETFALNVPTLLYWNPNDFLLREDAKEIYQQLHELGILHYDPLKAAKQLTLIDKNTLDWWQQPEIQAIRKAFCQQFAATAKNYRAMWQAVAERFSKKNDSNDSLIL